MSWERDTKRGARRHWRRECGVDVIYQDALYKHVIFSDYILFWRTGSHAQACRDCLKPSRSRCSLRPLGPSKAAEPHPCYWLNQNTHNQSVQLQRKVWVIWEIVPKTIMTRITSDRKVVTMTTGRVTYTTLAEREMKEVSNSAKAFHMPPPKWRKLKI